MSAGAPAPAGGQKSASVLTLVCDHTGHPVVSPIKDPPKDIIWVTYINLNESIYQPGDPPELSWPELPVDGGEPPSHVVLAVHANTNRPGVPWDVIDG